jgi:hypothetical protein
MINDLKIDPVNEKIYWCDGMTIWSSTLGKPLSPQSVANSASSIERIALDVVGGMIYFTEAGAPVNIRKVSMSGGSPSFVYTTPSSAGGLDVDPGTGRLYWSRPSASTGVYIDSVGVDGGDFRTFVNSPGTGDANRVALFLWP